MPVTIIKAKDFRVLALDEFFFDNNVWFYLYAPIANTNLSKQQKYGQVLSQIRSSNRPIFINSLVLSEFANAWLRLEFKLWSKNLTHSTDYKKDFVGKPPYIKAAREVRLAIASILEIATRGSDDFPSMNIDNLMESIIKRDFNDSYYMELAQKKGFKIVTDDHDLMNDSALGITIVTA